MDRVSKAARASGQSYRNVWGSLKRWEAQIGSPLVDWVQGQPARLTPFAERLLWAERRARVRMTPHVEALRRELQRVFSTTGDDAREVLEIAASHDLGLPLLQALVEHAASASGCSMLAGAKIWGTSPATSGQSRTQAAGGIHRQAGHGLLRLRRRRRYAEHGSRRAEQLRRVRSPVTDRRWERRVVRHRSCSLRSTPVRAVKPPNPQRPGPGPS